jgi:hypothetical protein
MSTQVEVSWIQFVVPDHAGGVPKDPSDPHCCGCGCKKCNPPVAKPKPPTTSTGPVRYGTGEIVLNASDLSTGGFGVPWGHTRSFANRLTQNTTVGNGYNWQVAEWPYLVFPSSTTVVVMGEATAALWFDLVGNVYVPRLSVREALLLDTVNNVYDLVELDGSITVFSAVTGAFIRHLDPAGNQLAVVSYASNQFNPTEV